jgi:hypothetical protein
VGRHRAQYVNRPYLARPSPSPKTTPPHSIHTILSGSPVACLRFPSLPLAALGAQSHFTCHPIHPFFDFVFASSCRPLGYPICTPASQSCPPTKR